MKNKAQQPKPAAEKQIKIQAEKKSEKPHKVPSRMGYHGKDEEKNLNPEE